MTHTETISGLVCSFRYFPRTDKWAGTIHALVGSSVLPGGSGTTLNEAVAQTKHLLRNKHGRS